MLLVRPRKQPEARASHASRVSEEGSQCHHQKRAKMWGARIVEEGLFAVLSCHPNINMVFGTADIPQCNSCNCHGALSQLVSKHGEERPENRSVPFVRPVHPHFKKCFGHVEQLFIGERILARLLECRLSRFFFPKPSSNICKLYIDHMVLPKARIKVGHVYATVKTTVGR